MTELGKLKQELKMDRGRRAQIRLLLDLLPQNCTAANTNMTQELLQVGSSDRWQTLEEQLDVVQARIAMQTHTTAKKQKLTQAQQTSTNLQGASSIRAPTQGCRGA